MAREDLNNGPHVEPSPYRFSPEMARRVAAHHEECGKIGADVTVPMTSLEWATLLLLCNMLQPRPAAGALVIPGHLIESLQVLTARASYLRLLKRGEDVSHLEASMLPLGGLGGPCEQASVACTDPVTEAAKEEPEAD